MKDNCSSVILEFTKYVNKKIKHYKKIFSLYYTNYRTDCIQTKMNDKTLFSNYIKILINVNLYEKNKLENCNINALISNMVIYDKIFDNLLCIDNLESCDKYLILKSVYYIRSLIKMIKKIKISLYHWIIVIHVRKNLQNIKQQLIHVVNLNIVQIILILHIHHIHLILQIVIINVSFQLLHVCQI